MRSYCNMNSEMRTIIKMKAFSIKNKNKKSSLILDFCQSFTLAFIANPNSYLNPNSPNCVINEVEGPPNSAISSNHRRLIRFCTAAHTPIVPELRQGFLKPKNPPGARKQRPQMLHWRTLNSVGSYLGWLVIKRRSWWSQLSRE
uniref:Uncharacterized protein n=1 Tax=Opuntia streptacantha TaxID=393608 RepID=A0A7C8Z8Y5_OPUST